MKRTHMTRLKRGQALAPASITASTNGLDVDTLGYHSATFLINVGALTGANGSNYWNVSLQEADDDGTGSPDTYSNVADADIATTDALTTTNGIWKVLNSTGLANAVYPVAYKGNKRWTRLVYTLVGTLTTICAATYELGEADALPATTLDGVTVTTDPTP